MSRYVYIKSEPHLWTVGFYAPDGSWQSESDHGSPAAAADRVAWLNGATQYRDLVFSHCREHNITFPSMASCPACDAKANRHAFTEKP